MTKTVQQPLPKASDDNARPAKSSAQSGIITLSIPRHLATCTVSRSRTRETNSKRMEELAHELSNLLQSSNCKRVPVNQK